MPTVWKIVIVIVVTLAVVGGGTYYYMNQKLENEKSDLQSQINELNKQIEDLQATQTTAPTDSDTDETADETAGWKTYTNSKYGFSLDIPNNYSVLEEQSYEGARGVILRFGKNKNTFSYDYSWIKLEYFVQDVNLSYLENNFVSEFGDDLSERKVFKIDGHDAVSYLKGGFASGNVTVSTNGSASLQIEIYPDNETSSVVYNRILESFKY